MEITLELFEERCHEVLGELFREHGFEPVGAYSRLRGYAVEFARDADRIFVDKEGGVVSFDLILAARPDRFYRIDLNQLLWFNGTRSLAKCDDWDEGLRLFETGFTPIASVTLSFDSEKMDSRFCFPMSREQLDNYIRIQRG